MSMSGPSAFRRQAAGERAGRASGRTRGPGSSVPLRSIHRSVSPPDLLDAERREMRRRVAPRGKPHGVAAAGQTRRVQVVVVLDLTPREGECGIDGLDHVPLLLTTSTASTAMLAEETLFPWAFRSWRAMGMVAPLLYWVVVLYTSFWP